MQLYEGLPVITNKVRPEERKGVPHHLLGCIGIHEQPWTVQNFVSQANRVIDDIHTRGKLPILVGGTHYYLQSLLFKSSIVTNADGERTTSTACNEAWPILEASTEEMFAELKRVDPVIASRWHPNDRRKIRRSLEIFLQTGKRASDVYDEQQEDRASQSTPAASSTAHRNGSEGLCFPTLLFWTHSENERLSLRIDARVDEMMGNGLLDEVHNLDKNRLMLRSEEHPIDDSRGIWIAIGYKEFRAYRDAIQRDEPQHELARLLADAVDRTKIATRQYSKSQSRWIRIKLANALRDTNSPMPFVLDTSDPKLWDDNVLQPAERLTRKFLAGSDLLTSHEQSDLGKSLLPQGHANNGVTQQRNQRKTQTCEICGVTAPTEQQWQQHVSSKGHKNTMRAKSRP